MARGSDQAKGAATSAQNISNTNASNASALYGTLAPSLMAEAANPAGFGPSTLAQMDTAAQQSAGGANAGAVGQAGLLATRERNAGGADAAIAKASRTAGETLSKGVLGTRIQNAELQNEQRQNALRGLGSLFGTQSGASVDALGQIAKNVQADVDAQNASWNWAKFILDPMLQAAGGAAPTIGKAFGV